MKTFMRSYNAIIIFLILIYSFSLFIEINIKSTKCSFCLLFFLLPTYLLLVLFIPFLHKQQKREWLFVIGGILYLLVKFLIFEREINSTTFYYTIFIELVILLIGIGLAFHAAESSLRLQKSIDHIILPKLGHRVYDDMHLAKRIVEHEFIRGRRYSHPITTIVVDPAMNPIEAEEKIDEAFQEVKESIKGNYITQKIAQIIEDETRLTDIVIEWDQQGRLVVVCPETTAETSQVLIDRIQTAVSKQMGILLNYGVASFPNDAHTFDALLEKAESEVGKKPGLILGGKAEVLKPIVS